MRIEVYDKIMSSGSYPEFANYFSAGCTRCSLSEHEGNYPVLYRGNPESNIMLIGEAPGLRERELGSPFTGPAGQLLDKMMNAIGLDTNNNMLITNITYCRPVAPRNSGRQNYTPKITQVSRCWPFTRKAIEIVKPKIVIACGLPAAKTILGDSTIRMKDIEGSWRNNIFIMRHPAAVLHERDRAAQQNTKNKMWEYLKYFRSTYKKKLEEK